MENSKKQFVFILIQQQQQQQQTTEKEEKSFYLLLLLGAKNRKRSEMKALGKSISENHVKVKEKVVKKYTASNFYFIQVFFFAH